jgi:DNA-binding NtrC family response regulator
VPIDIPPLREHKEDIPDLVNHFLARFAADSEKEIEGIAPAALNALMEYHWPGNVRQLENSVERAVALSSGRMIDEKDIHLDTRQSKAGVAASASANQFLPEGMTLEQWEDNMIRESLRRANGNKSQAARLLGLSRNALRYRLGKLGVADEGE